jgi:hypothetical protein
MTSKRRKSGDKNEKWDSEPIRNADLPQDTFLDAPMPEWRIVVAPDEWWMFRVVAWVFNGVLWLVQRVAISLTNIKGGSEYRQLVKEIRANHAAYWEVGPERRAKDAENERKWRETHGISEEDYLEWCRKRGETPK